MVSWRRSTPKGLRVPAAIIRMSCGCSAEARSHYRERRYLHVLETAVTSGGYETNPIPALTNGKRTYPASVEHEGSRAATSPMGICSPDNFERYRRSSPQERQQLSSSCIESIDLGHSRPPAP